jgi:NADPH:quinone reductase-like Zn-dependent oxidoreductase
MKLPVNTKSVILPAYNDNLIRAIIGMKTEERTIEQLKPDEVLIQMEAAPCNPSDIAFITGGYNIRKALPAVPGFEGAGKVVASGENARELEGKRVSCFTQSESSGTWSEYFVAEARDCIILKEGMDMEQAACFSINPLTAYGLFELAKIKKCEAIIQNASGGQVAEFIRVLAQKEGIQVINIVRKEDHVEELFQKGVEFVLNSTSENFEEKVRQTAHDLNATIAFDAVGGEQTGVIYNNLPNGSEIVVYGGLSGLECAGIDTLEVIFKNKIIKGFNLNDWIKQKSREEFLKITDKLQDMFIAGKIKTQIQGSYGLEDVVNGIRSYIKSMSKGKILFKP